MLNLNKSDTKKIVRTFFFLTVILITFFVYELGNRPFADPDEGRYVEIPREMTVTGDYITPRLNGLKYFEKPPLLYWLQAATIKTIGMNEFSMRLWIIFFAIIGCLSVFFVGLACNSQKIGILSAAILATNLLYYAHSRLIILDLAVSVLMSGALWCFFLAFVRNNKSQSNEKNKQSNKKVIVAMYALSALACLTKGLIGAILPGLVAFLWICFTNNWKKIKEMISIPGILIFLVIFLPWHIAVCLKNSDFFHFYFVVEHFLRYTTQMHCRYQPTWFFLPIIIIGLLPWSGFSLVAIWKSFSEVIKKNRFVQDKSENIFLLCWIFGILAFYSFSNSKLIPYILPIFPPISFLTAKILDRADNTPDENFKTGVIINLILFIGAFVAFYFAKNQISDVINEFPETNMFIIVFGITIILCAIVLIYTIILKRSLNHAVLLYIFLAVNLMWTINKAAPFYQAVKKPSVKQLAQTVRLNRKNDDLVFCYKKYQQDFPVYLESVIGVVDHNGELNFGNQAEKNDRMISEKKLIELWKVSDKRIFVLMNRKFYKDFLASSKFSNHIILDFDKNFVVLVNK